MATSILFKIMCHTIGINKLMPQLTLDNPYLWVRRENTNHIRKFKDFPIKHMPKWVSDYSGVVQKGSTLTVFLFATFLAGGPWLLEATDGGRTADRESAAGQSADGAGRCSSQQGGGRRPLARLFLTRHQRSDRETFGAHAARAGVQGAVAAGQEPEAKGGVESDRR